MSKWTRIGERPTEEGDYWVEFADGTHDIAEVVEQCGRFIVWHSGGHCKALADSVFDNCRWCRATYPEPPPRGDKWDEMAKQYFSGCRPANVSTLAVFLREKFGGDR